MPHNENINIALVESDIKWCDKEANINELEARLVQCGREADIVVLPELFSTGYVTNDDETIANLAEKNTGYTISKLLILAKKHGIAIAGSYIAKTLNKAYNRGFIIEPSGDETYYDKHHLFTIAGEDKYYTIGKNVPPVLRYRGWNIMLIVCYDLRFPEWCRNVGLKYDVLLVVANWPKSREYSWKQLLIARAIENQCYVCGVNRSGSDGYGIEYGNSSIIIDYKGHVISNSESSKNGVISSSLDLKSLQQFREKFPAWRDADNFTLNL
ncbi:MAG: nitrilase-related carbon-nitrogen hydrolase [Muribaculaceae bacterium]